MIRSEYNKLQSRNARYQPPWPRQITQICPSCLGSLFPAHQPTSPTPGRHAAGDMNQPVQKNTLYVGKPTISSSSSSSSKRAHSLVQPPTFLAARVTCSTKFLGKNTRGGHGRTFYFLGRGSSDGRILHARGLIRAHLSLMGRWAGGGGGREDPARRVRALR